MARLEFRMPDIGEGLAEVEIVQWLVGIGDRVTENQPIADVETDKSIVTMPAPATGSVAEFRASPGERVKVGSVLLVLDVADAAVPAPDVPPAEESRVVSVSAPGSQRSDAGLTRAAPAVRKRAAELGVDLDAVRGTGPGGRILPADVEEHATRARAPAPAVDDDLVDRIPVRGLRRRIAEAMTQSVRAIPHVCGFHELDAGALTYGYERLKPAATAAGVRLTYLAFLVRATAAALAEHRLLNASFEEEGPTIVVKKEHNIGIATATPDGLVVPVIRRADRLGLFEIAREAERLTAAARTRRLEPSDLQDGTFTISNVGASNGWFGTSIIRYPEAAILGIGRITPRPVAVDGAVEVRPILPLSLTFDHRVIDGDEALAFVLTLRGHIERPDSPLYRFS